jgi:hypothetical protein
MRILSPLGVGVAISITLLAMSFLLRPGLEDPREQRRLDARATAQAQRTIAVVATATARARHCIAPERVVVTARLHPPPGQTDTWYYAAGTARNTCNYALRARLDIHGLTARSEEVVAAVRETISFAPHEERHFVHTLASFRPGYIDHLTIAVRIQPD